jgi:hypothetical protein
MILLLFAMISKLPAADLPGEELYSAPQSPSYSPKSLLQNGRSRGATEVPRGGVRSEYAAQRGRQSNEGSGRLEKASNLPQDYATGFQRQSTASELILPPKGAIDTLQSLKVGEKLEARISHSVIAFPDEKSPVIAELTENKFRGYKLIGESTLEPNSKRVFINFQRVAIGNKIYFLKAAGLSDEGQPGLSGEYHSREAEFFAGDFISSFVAGYFDGLIPRKTNVFGQTEADPTVDTAVKKGIASGAMSSSERFREKLKKIPEFSEIKGPFNIEILILDAAQTK